MTDSLKTTVKLIGEVPVGSAWPTAWLIVTEGGVTSSQVTVLSVLVEATFGRALSVDGDALPEWSR